MNSILNKIRAGYPGIYLLTHEEQRAEAMLKSVADTIDYGLHAWSCTDGRICMRTGQTYDQQDLGDLLSGIRNLPEKTILLLRDLHLYLKEPNPVIFRLLKDALAHAKSSNITLVALAPEVALPADLSKLFSVEEFRLPTREELSVVIENFCLSTKTPEPSDTDSVIDAASGLTTIEAEDALALSVIETSTLSPAVIAREKAAAVKKNGLLEIIDSTTKVEDIGGLENLIADLLSKRNSFTRAAREYGLSSPRGILAVGQAGTGKSLTAQACGSIFQLPALKLEAGGLFGSLVGQSEANWRSAFATARAISPCILWIDEADGLFCGGKSGGTSDGGTTNRVIKAILQDMQFNSEGIFFVFTANDIDGFPDALVDRLDVWSVDLPTRAEREAIWKIHIAKRRRDPGHYSLPDLAAATEGFSGRQIEQVWLKALTVAFNDRQREPENSDVIVAANSFTATSVTMADAIDARRRRLANKARPASIAEKKISGTGQISRKLAA